MSVKAHVGCTEVSVTVVPQAGVASMPNTCAWTGTAAAGAPAARVRLARRLCRRGRRKVWPGLPPGAHDALQKAARLKVALHVVSVVSTPLAV